MVNKAGLEKLKKVTQDPATFVEYAALLVWKEGIPYLANTPAKISESPREKILSLLEKSLDLPYDGKDPALQGLTCGEAMVINLTRDASYGSHEARTAILDRLLGRPKQSIESVQLTGDLNSFLSKVAEDMQVNTIEVTAEETSNPNLSVEDL